MFYETITVKAYKFQSSSYPLKLTQSGSDFVCISFTIDYK